MQHLKSTTNITPFITLFYLFSGNSTLQKPTENDFFFFEFVIGTYPPSPWTEKINKQESISHKYCINSWEKRKEKKIKGNIK